MLVSWNRGLVVSQAELRGLTIIIAPFYDTYLLFYRFEIVTFVLGIFEIAKKSP